MYGVTANVNALINQTRQVQANLACLQKSVASIKEDLAVRPPVPEVDRKGSQSADESLEFIRREIEYQIKDQIKNGVESALAVYRAEGRKDIQSSEITTVFRCESMVKQNMREKTESMSFAIDNLAGRLWKLEQQVAFVTQDVGEKIDDVIERFTMTVPVQETEAQALCQEDSRQPDSQAQEHVHDEPAPAQGAQAGVECNSNDDITWTSMNAGVVSEDTKQDSTAGGCGIEGQCQGAGAGAGDVPPSPVVTASKKGNTTVGRRKKK